MSLLASQKSCIFLLKTGLYEPLREKNLPLGFPNSSNTNRAVQPQEMARGFKFQIREVDGLYYLCCANKGADQLQCHHAADPHLCFAYAKAGFLATWLLSELTCSLSNFP